MNEMKYQILKMVMHGETEHRFKKWSDIPDVRSISETFLDVRTVRLSFNGGNPLHVAEWMHFNLPSMYYTIGNTEVTIVCDWGEHVYRFDLETNK